MKVFVSLLFFCLSFFVFNTKTEFCNLDFIPKNAEYNVFTYKEKVNNFEVFKSVKNGNAFVLSVSKNDAKILFYSCDYLIGESFCFKGNEKDFLDIVKKFKFVFKTECEFENIKTVYGFTNILKTNTYIEEKGKKYNIQMCLNNGYITIGCPIIVGSFWLKILFW